MSVPARRACRARRRRQAAYREPRAPPILVTRSDASTSQHRLDARIRATVQAFEGLSAILNDNLHVTGIGLSLDQDWARLVGLILAVLSALLNFMFIPYYPIWSIVVIAVDIAAVWALTTVTRYE